MLSTDRLKRQAAASWRGRSEREWPGPFALAAPSFSGPCRVRLCWVGLLLAAAQLACRGEPADVRLDEPRDVPLPVAPIEHPPSALIDLASEAGPRHVVEGFSLPERVGARFASWSEGEVSTVTANLAGGARDYLVAFLAEPYHRLGEVRVNVALNGRPIGEAQVGRGWRAYRLAVSGDRVVAGPNSLSFQYSKTARPSDLDPQSSDVRALSVRFDQIQIAPITSRVQLGFGSKDALALAALGEGWVRDPSDRGTGTWTLGSRAQLTFHLLAPDTQPGSPSYELSLTARAPQGVAERNVALTLNGAPLGSLAFGASKMMASLVVPADRLRAENELGLEFTGLEPPPALDSQPKDQRLLGLRVFELVVASRDASSPAATRAEPPIKESIADAAR